MKRWTLVVLGLVIVFALAFLFTRRGSSSGDAATAGNEPGAPPSAARQMTWARSGTPGRLVPGPVRPGSGSLTIRGRVVDGSGPVAGAFVVATRGEAGDALSQRECECDNHCGQQLLECGCGMAAQQLVELVTRRSGEVVPVAEATSGPDGGFELTGLEPGEVALWAERTGAAVGFARHVAAGEQNVVVTLAPGRVLRGTVVSESGEPLAGVSLTAVHKEESRFFDALSAGNGAFSIGPVPAGAYRVVAWDGVHLADQGDFGENDDEVRIVLTDPRTLTGRVLLEGAPVAGAQVHVEGEHRKEDVTTAADGAFAITGLRKGTYDVTVRSGPLGGSARASLRVPNPEPIEIELGALGAIAGAVRDPSNAPIAGARVKAVRTDSAGAQEATSGADGQYRIELLPGRWRLTASREGYLGGETQKTSVGLDPGRPVDFVLEPARVVSGVVVGPGGAPVAGADVDASSESLKARSARTGADGTFSLDLESGAYKITAEHDHFRKATAEVTAPASGLRLVLTAGAVLRGTVLDAEGSPVAKATITVWEAGERVLAEGYRPRWQTTQTGADGRFELDGLEEGPNRVLASAGGQQAERRATEEVSLSLSAPAEVVLRLAKTVEISGSVVDETGAGVADVKVYARPDGELDDHDEEDDDDDGLARPSTTSATTHADGRFVLSAEASAQYSLSIDRMLLDQDAPVRVTAPARDVRLPVRRRGTVRGRVIDEAGKPVLRFTVDMRPFVTEDGVFRHPVDRNFTSPLAVAAEGYAASEIPVVVKKGVEIDLGDIVLKRGRTVRGLVVDEDSGKPVAGARIVLDPGLGASQLAFYAKRQPGDATTPTTGRFTLVNVPERDATVAVVHDEYVATTFVIPAADPGPTIRLRRGATILGRVVAADGTGLEGVGVAAVNAKVHDMESVATDAAGEFRMGGLVPGRWILTPGERGGAHALQPAEVTLSGREEVRVELRERSGGVTVQVHLVDPARKQANAFAVLVRGSLTDAELLTLNRGVDRMILPTGMPPSFPAVPPGAYTVFVTQMPSREQVGRGEMRVRYLLEPITVAEGAPEQTIEIVLDPAKLRDVPTPSATAGE